MRVNFNDYMNYLEAKTAEKHEKTAKERFAECQAFDNELKRDRATVFNARIESGEAGESVSDAALRKLAKDL